MVCFMFSLGAKSDFIFAAGHAMRFVGWPLAAALLATIAALLSLRLIEPQYSAAMTVGPARNGAAAVGLRVGGGGRFGLTTPGTPDEFLSDFARYQELLRATPVAERLLAESDITRRLFADRWDAAAQEWRAAPGVWPAIKQAGLALAGRPLQSPPPDAVALAQLLHRQVSISSVGTGAMRRIVFRHPDRDFALTVLGRIAAAADSHLRNEAARRARAQIDFVRARLRETTIIEYREALTQVLADEERALMALGIDLPYAVDVIEPPHAAALPDWPEALLLAGGTGAAAFCVALFISGRRRHGWRAPDADGAA